jgi:hypothetical protein
MHGSRNQETRETLEKMMVAILESEQFVLNFVELHTNHQVYMYKQMVHQQLEDYNSSHPET